MPSWLLSLQSNSVQGTKLEPELSENWKLTGFKYNGEHKYQPQEVLYFVNLELENDHLGLSDIEPIVTTCRARNYLLEKGFPEITERLWAPYVHMQADTTGMSDADETAFLQGLVDSATSGKSTAYNKSVTSTVVALNINLTGLVQLMDKLEETIIREFGTPRFLINKTPENRATAYVEFEAFISGPTTNTQRYFKRELERQWYQRLVKLALAKNNFSGEVPVRVKHVWKPIRASDIYDMAAAVAEKCTEKVTAAVYADWGAVTSGLSTTNPLSAITLHINTIEKAVKRPVDILAMHPTLCDKFVQNTFVRDLIWAGMAKFNDTSTGGYFKLPNRPQITVVTDLNLTETPDDTHGPILASTTAPGIVFGEGPTMAVQYRDEDIGADIYKIMQWLEPKIVRDAALSKICT